MRKNRIKTNRKARRAIKTYLRKNSNGNPAMNTDLYEFTMAEYYYLQGYANVQVICDCIYRKNPGLNGQEGGYAIAAGQEKLIRFLQNMHFTKADCEYLIKEKHLNPDFVKYLSTYRWNGTVYAVPEGTVVYPQEPIVRIQCDVIGASLIETYLLRCINHGSLITTNASRIVAAANGKPVMEFGGRRAQGDTASLDGSKYAVIGGCVGTANCLAEMKFGSPVVAMGTVAHSFIEFFPDEYTAFKAMADAHPENVSLLIDTYDIFGSGAPNAIRIDDYLIEKYPDNPNKRVKSIRIDSGDLAYESIRLREIFDKAGKPYIKIVASNGLDEKTVYSLEHEQKAQIDSYGIGDHLITGGYSPVFGAVYKMVAVQNKNGEWEPRMKCSNTIAKAIIPGYKKVYRLYDSEGKSCMDIISMYDEKLEPEKEGDPIKTIKCHNTYVYDQNPEYVIAPAKIEPLLVPFIVDGELVAKLPSIPEIRSKVKWQLENEMWPTQRRLENPSKYRVCTTDRVYKLQNDMYYSLHTKYNKVI